MMRIAERRPGPSDVLAMGALFLLMLVAVGAHFSFGVFFTPLLNDLGWSRTSLSSIFSLYMAVYALAQISAGTLSDRFGAPLVIFVTGIAFGAGLLLMSSVHEIWQAYLAYGLLVAIGFSGSYIPAITATSQLLGHKRSIALGVATAGSGAGVILVGPVAHRLVEAFTARGAYRVLGIVVVVGTAGVAACLTYFQSATRRASTKQSFGCMTRPVYGMSLGQVARTGKSWSLMALHSAFNVAVAVYAVHAVPLAEVAGLSAGAASAGLVWAGLGRLGGSLLMGQFARKADRIRLFQWLAAAVAMAMALLPVVGGDPVGYFAMSALFGLGFGGTTVVFPLIISDVFGARSVGGVFGFLNLGYGIGGALGPLLAGWFFDLRGSYMVGFLVAAVCSAIAAIGLPIVLEEATL